MKIDDKLLNHLEKLAMLKIAPEKRTEVEAHLSDILGFVEKLGELDTAGVEAVATVVDTPALLRADEPLSQNEVTQSILEHAPNAQEGCFVVPRVVG